MTIKKKTSSQFDINMEIQFGDRVGHGVWLIEAKLFRLQSLHIF